MFVKLNYIFGYLLTKQAKAINSKTAVDKKTDDSSYLITPRPDDLTIFNLDAVELFDHWIVHVGSLFVPHPQFTPVATAHVDITEALWP